MKSRPKYIVPHRRRREDRTDYRQRLRLLKSGEPRLVIRKSQRNTICQIITYDKNGDKVLVSADSKELKKYGWKGHTGNIPAAYLTGYLCGLRAKKSKTGKAVLDLGLYNSVKGSRLYAAMKGAVEAGINVPHSEEIVPTKSRLEGKHISDYAAKLKKSDADVYKKQFSGYLQKKLKPKDLPKHVQEVKKKLK